MVSSVYWEWNLLLESLKLGLQLGIIYDGFRLFRIIITHHKFFADLEDIIYWIISTFLIFRMQLQLANGVTRGFVVAGILLGMFFYHRIFARKWIGPVEKQVEHVKTWLTKQAKKIRIKLSKRIYHSTSNGRSNDEKKYPCQKKKTKQPCNAAGNDGCSGYDAGSGS